MQCHSTRLMMAHIFFHKVSHMVLRKYCMEYSFKGTMKNISEIVNIVPVLETGFSYLGWLKPQAL